MAPFFGIFWCSAVSIVSKHNREEMSVIFFRERLKEPGKIQHRANNMLAYLLTPEWLINAWHWCVSRSVFGSCRCPINKARREIERQPEHMCRSCMAAVASLVLKAALQSHLVIRVSADEVTKATPNIHSGSPHQDTHKHTRKPSACSHGPVRCSGWNHPRQQWKQQQQ